VQLTPLYDRPSFFRLDVDTGDPAVPLLRQRRRLAALLAGFDAEQWAAPTRCDGWSVRDVLSHLVSTNQFWAFSIGAALGGEPTRFLASFDPVATPAQLVDADRAQPPAEVLARFVESTEALAATVGALDDATWSVPAEAPPGHVPLRAVALHALWDAWVHERDVVLPLGLGPVEERDEIVGSLVYAAALSPAFGIACGGTRTGTITVDVTDPDVRFVVDVGDRVVVHADDGAVPDDALHLRGAAIPLLEALSHRAPLPEPVGVEHRWLLSGLARAFDLEA
jgi:uncharacterized protein (TIGR03083 family)